MECSRIFSRAHTEKHICSPAKEKEIDIPVAFYLGNVSGMVSSRIMDDNYVENADETHFIINVDHGRTLGFSGESAFQYGDLGSDCEGFTMLPGLNGDVMQNSSTIYGF